jgi:intracellular multiplication protein IcmD
MLGIAFVAGLGFVIASLFKFKQHKDNPTQIPLGTPLALFAIGVILVFLSALFEPAGKTLFGDKAKSAGPTGDLTQIPTQ